jgi:hypothetical protein
MKDLGRKYRTFLKLKFSKFMSEATTEQAEEMSQCYKAMMDKVWHVDSTAMVLAWKDGALGKPLRPKTEFPKSKDGISSYVDNLWMQKGCSSYRALISHDLPMDTLFNDGGLQNWLSDQDLAINIERIQAQKITNVGHLLGYHALAANAKNLADAIQMQPAMQGIAVEVRSEFVRFVNKKTTGQRITAKVLQLYTLWDSASRARRALIQIYSSRANGLYPLGVQARFIPNVHDVRFIRNAQSMLAHTNSLKKQIKFMESTSFTPCYTIIELDHRIEEVDMTLRQAIMSIFASDDRTLFVAVDTSFYGDCVNFAYCNELESEAVTMISALPLFLFASLGQRCIWEWFTSGARHEASYYTYDMDRGIIPKDDSGITDTKLTNWEQLDDDDDDDDDFNDDDDPDSAAVVIQPFRLLLGHTGDNAYDDHHTIKTAVFQTAQTSVDLVSDEEDTGPFSTPQGKQVSVASVDITDTSTTPSTLTKTSEEDILLEKIAARMTSDPDMIAKFQAMMFKLTPEAAQAANTTAPGTKNKDVQ